MTNSKPVCRKTAVVIGAGVGGITTAALLARQGWSVTVFEKNATPGGRCGQVIHRGHTFDTGATMFLMRDIFEEVFAQLGEKLDDHLRLIRIDPTCRVYFEDGVRLDFTDDLRVMQQQMDHLEPGSFGGYLRMLAEGYDCYRLAMPRFIQRNIYSYREFCSPSNLAVLWKLRAFQSHATRVANQMRHPHLRAFLTYQDVYVGLNPFRAPAIFSLFPYMELVGGLWYPEGGMGKVAQQLVKIAQGLGVKFVLGSTVKRIAVENGKATGVVLADNQLHPADVVVANADVPYVYRELLPDPKPARKLQRKEYAPSAIVFYWGVNQRCAALGTQHSVFLSKDYMDGFKTLEDPSRMPEGFHFYVNAPAIHDGSVAPPGQDSLMVIVPVANVHPQAKQDFKALQVRARDYVLKRLGAMGLTNLQQLIKFEICYRPRTWKALLNLERGSTFGSLSHSLFQVSYFRPSNRHDRYPNVYFTGGSTRPGSGVPMVLISAQLTAERVMKETA